MKNIQKPLIGIDVMGGDFAPSVTLQAALFAAKQGLFIVLFGRKSVIEQGLFVLDSQWLRWSLCIVDCSQEIAMYDSPARSAFLYQDSSLVKMVQYLREGKIDVAVSAGNSGAFVASGVLYGGLISGITKPALSSFFPKTQGSSFLMLDLGATVDCRAEHLVQFASLGASYFSVVQGAKQPRVALLSNGHESSKGTAAIKSAYKTLSSSSVVNFVGNIESRNIFEGSVDVVVTDGFSGNVLLKGMQGVMRSFVTLLKKEQEKSYLSALALKVAGYPLKRVFDVFDYTQKGGALVLGLQKPLFVVHGSATAFMIAQALIQAELMMKNNVFGNFLDRVKLLYSPHHVLSGVTQEEEV